MEDRDIVTLFWARSEQAIAETARKYGAYCRTIIGRILPSREDAEECLSDTYWGAWNTMPPQRPRCLPPLLGRIARNAALDRYRSNSAQRRSGAFEAVLDELAECLGGGSAEEALDAALLEDALRRFLSALPQTSRRVFLRRYWYCESIEEIAAAFSFSPSKVKSMLHRARQGLKQFLQEEGFSL